MKLSLRARWALWAALATGLAAVLVSVGLFVAVSRLLAQAQDDRALAAARDAGERLETLIRQRRDDPLGLGAGHAGSPLPGPLDALSVLTGRVTVTAADLERVARQGGERGTELRLSVLGAGAQAGQWVSVQTGRFPGGVPAGLSPRSERLGDVLVVVRPLRGGGLLTVTQDIRALGAAREAFARALAWLLPAALLLSLGLGWWVAGRLLRPVGALEGAARAIGAGGDLRTPLPNAGEDDELARLALTLQQSFGRLADSREREQAFLRAAAHDLRSPLTALQARVDGTLARERDPERYRHDLRELGRDITRLSTLANHLLLLARDPSALASAPVPLRDLAAEAVDRARELDPHADVDLLPSAPLTVQGDRVLLGQAVWNLTVNAVRHAPGASVTVRVSGDGHRARVTVQDDGPGVSPEVLGKLGEAFYRPSESRSADPGGVAGHGLGLALARRAAELHGGELTLRSAPGAGFCAELSLPSSPAASSP
ncbi:sensor histidine kinase [Deinococcus wulumuqiensis]|uniref:histidine kinase n=2 Tax=Deinococcus wulumuqiensis TaxID=980427 RepID=A0AAV4K5G1_9DEIO|nr:HAMP domain-containing sensor histidine kinase [Deinococcus wulumuqiensis]QII21571.1 HAMP domain-containing histidine kinase [Deinococcus wulumuqiensis R12]GGI83805.1 two-component sensor histidine kinase [Deinococcus wulumuqiensis]GGP29706.1 two-component sensor histidine kinase [Deinococcus wulumuqiensis]